MNNFKIYTVCVYIYTYIINIQNTHILSRSKLPYHLLCTTRGSLPLNINSHSDSVSHHSSYLGLIALPHLHLIYTHTYKQHTSMHSLRSLDLPRLSLLSVTTRVCFPVITSALILDSVIPLWLPWLGLFPWTLILAACPDYSACLSDYVSALSTLFPLLVIDPVLFDHSK